MRKARNPHMTSQFLRPEKSSDLAGGLSPSAEHRELLRQLAQHADGMPMRDLIESSGLPALRLVKLVGELERDAFCTISEEGGEERVALTILGKRAAKYAERG